MKKKDKLFHIGKTMYQLMPLFKSKIQINKLQDSLMKKGYQESFNKNHIRILFLLNNHDSMISSDLGKLIGVERGSVTTLIKYLVEKDFVEKSPSKNDKRKQFLTLSKSGKKLVEEIDNLYLDEIKYAFEKLDEKEINKFINSLDAMVDIIQKL